MELLDKIDMIKKIDDKIKICKNDNFMTEDEMRFIRNKCDKGEPITPKDLLRYSRAVSQLEKIFDLEIEKNIILEDLKGFKDFYEKYII